MFPYPFIINREKAINIYGIKSIQKNGLEGIWVPLYDIGTVWESIGDINAVKRRI